MTRLLLDQGLPRTAATILRAQGYDAVHVGEIGMARADDLSILNVAMNERRVCCTLVADFHRQLALRRLSLPSIIRIRIEGLKGPQAAEIIGRTAKDLMADLEAGAAITVTRHRVRVRRLPFST